MLLKYIARFILYLLGWKLINDVDVLLSYKRAVVIYPHSTYFDFFLSLIYFFAHPELFEKTVTLMKPSIFNYFGFILRKLNVIPANSVNEIVEQLKQKQEFLFLISPKGTRSKKDWRKGYYHIAKLTGSVLLVSGADFSSKSVKIFSAISSEESEEVVRNKLQTDLSKMTAMFPECEN